jgi:integrase
MAKGSIEQRGENSWRLRVDLGYRPDGTRNRPTRTITVEDKKILRSTRKLNEYLDDQLALFKQEVLSGNYFKPEKMTFGHFVEHEWGPKYASDKDNLAPLTFKTYKRHIKNHINPVFENMYLDEIQTIHIVTFTNDLKQKESRKDGKKGTLSSGTVAYIYRTLKNILNRATDWKFIKVNPMEDTKKPKVTDSEFEYYDEDEAHEVIKALNKEVRKWRLFILGSMIGGCRRGELIALEWTDVDFEKMTITISKSISDTENSQAIEKGTKNQSSKRIIDMPEWFMEEMKIHLREWKKEKLLAGDKWKGTDQDGDERFYVFHGGFGKPYYHTYPSEWWKKFLKRHDLKEIRLHDLRHSSATLLIEAGASMKAIQKRLGHSKYQTTANIYTHVTKKVSRDTAEKFNKFDPRNSVPNPSPNVKNISS